MSLVKNAQVDGRGARACEEIGKKDFINIDMGRNWVRFGRFGQIIDWEGIFNDPGKGDPQDENSTKRDHRECTECGMVIPMRSKTCGFCGDITSEKELEKIMLSEATAEQIKQHRLDNLPIHLRKSFTKMTKEQMIEYGKHMNYSPKWAHVRWVKMQQYRNK
jgi:hypothetical protein